MVLATRLGEGDANEDGAGSMLRVLVANSRQMATNVSPLFRTQQDDYWLH